MLSTEIEDFSIFSLALWCKHTLQVHCTVPSIKSQRQWLKKRQKMVFCWFWCEQKKVVNVKHCVYSFFTLYTLQSAPICVFDTCFGRKIIIHYVQHFNFNYNVTAMNVWCSPTMKLENTFCNYFSLSHIRHS